MRRRVPTFVERQFRRPYVDFALCLLFKPKRLSLPMIDPVQVWPGFETSEVTIGVLPKGDWATPTNDHIVLMKLVGASEPARILELGSYRGHTAKGMLEHTPDTTTVTAVDIEPDHGEAYRGSDLESRIDRRVGAAGLDLFSDSERHSFDLVFVDADHRREAAAADTDLAFEMVSDDGMILWHDYSNWGWFTGDCGVPEVLNELSQSVPIGHLLGSNIAVHKREWARDQTGFDDAVEGTNEQLRQSHWQSDTARRYSF